MSQLRTTYRFLTTAQVRRLYITFISDTDPSQPSMLESAVISPINVKHYEQENDLFQLAATLSEKLVKNHAYQDGNKRVALVAADMFLKINGHKLETTPLATSTISQELANAHVAVATGRWGRDELAEYYRKVSAPLDSATADIEDYKGAAEEH